MSALLQQCANYPAASTVPTAVFQICKRKGNKFRKAYAAQRWLLNWNGKMSSVLLCKDWDNKIENPPLPNREFLTDTGNPCITSELFKYGNGGA